MRVFYNNHSHKQLQLPFGGNCSSMFSSSTLFRFYTYEIVDKHFVVRNFVSLITQFDIHNFSQFIQ